MLLPPKKCVNIKGNKKTIYCQVLSSTRVSNWPSASSSFHRDKCRPKFYLIQTLPGFQVNPSSWIRFNNYVQNKKKIKRLEEEGEEEETLRSGDVYNNLALDFKCPSCLFFFPLNHGFRSHACTNFSSLMKYFIAPRIPWQISRWERRTWLECWLLTFRLTKF